MSTGKTSYAAVLAKTAAHSVVRLGAAWVVFALIFVQCPALAGQSAAAPGRLDLHRGWKLQSSCAADVSGERVSSAEFKDLGGWIDAEVPSTVLGAQIAAGQFPDALAGMNLRKIPGTDYPIGKIFTNLPMPETSPYHCSWWYRTEFSAPFSKARTTWLHFDGINYRANIWINGRKLAKSEDVVGAYRSYDFDISSYLIEEEQNALAVEVFAQSENDLGINFVDWNPAPADKSLGLWRGVSLYESGPAAISNPQVITRFDDDGLATASLTVVADVTNATDRALVGVVTGTIGSIRFRQAVDLDAHSTKVARFSPEQFPQLKVKNPRVWWPYQYGTPHLEKLAISVLVDGSVSDAKSVRFGIREVQSDLNERGHRQFKINHRNILIRGGGWAPDVFYREPRERIRQELEYVKHMNLNAIRLEGKLGSEDMFDIADEEGILIMAGWCCCDHWEHWDKWTTKDHDIANASLRSQISRLRSHPSVFVWLNGSDGPPPAQVENDYISILKERDWANPFVSSASATPTKVTGASGVKMSGPYDYVPPEYWYLDKNKFGGAYGFNTETGPGPAIPTAQSIRRTLPKESWWPMDEQWNFHAGLGKFAQYNIFNGAMASTYGPATGLDDYSRRAQLMSYDGERAMFEAYAANKYASTGVILWMLNNAWPSFIWHLYDYYLVPGGGYFGTRKANEPVHVQYRYDDRTVVVVNSTLTALSGLRVSAKVVDTKGRQLLTKESTVELAPDGVASAFVLPQQGATTFAELQLRDPHGALVSENFYWLPSRLSQLDWDKSNYFYTPATAYADMRDLADIPAAKVSASARRSGNAHDISVTLKNPGKSVAFFLHCRAVKRGTDKEVTPVFWSDNFVSLLPGEARVLTVRSASLNLGDVEIKIDGWNLGPATLRVAAPSATSGSARSREK